MKHYKEWNINEHPIVINNSKNRKRKLKLSPTILTLDIETTSFLSDNDGKTFMFDYKKEASFYKDFNKNGYCYIWMLSIDDTVFFGRYLEELKEFINQLNETINDSSAIIYVHNLSFEFQFLINILDFEDIYCKDRHKVLSCKYRNFTFKCSYALSNLSLEKLGKEENLNVQKKQGQLDYNLCRNSLTELTSEELEYCEYDCLVVYEYIKKMVNQYEHLRKIPLTHTGKVRRKLKEYIVESHGNKQFALKNWKERIAYISVGREIFESLCQAYAGGYTHANALHSNKVLKDIYSYDISSSYPSVLAIEKYPVGKFIDETKFGPENINLEKRCYLLKLRLTGVERRGLNTFISLSKCEVCKEPIIDNGRVVKSDEIIITLTDVDYNILLENYYIEKIEYLKIWSSIKGYLPKSIINLVLDLYSSKTLLKGVKGMEEQYNLLKSLLNSIYGMMCTKTIKNDVSFNNLTQEWDVTILTRELCEKKLQKQKEDLELMLVFQWGVWCTSYARRNLWSIVNKINEDVVYCDTDSIKFKNFEKNIIYIEEYNKKHIEKIKKAAADLNTPIEKFIPQDNQGNKRHIGFFEEDGVYEEFKTLGAKKYCYRENGELKMTLSGVSKKGVLALKNNIKKFDIGLVFDYNTSGKSTLFYNDEQQKCVLTDYQGNSQTINSKHGICLLPTTYELGLTEEYRNFIDNCYLEFL